MGYPVKSISMFEDRIQHIRKGYVLIIFANAESDSRAVEYVLRNFHEMDTISAEVSFYLPGYGAVSKESAELSSRYDDSHVSIRTSSYVDNMKDLEFIKRIISPRLGPLYFNIAEYVDFVMEFTRRKPGYHYMGNCEMNLVPVNDGRPDYRNSQSYDLDAIEGGSLDYFFHFVFRSISRSFAYHDDSGSFLGRLFGRDKRVVAEIDGFYQGIVEQRDLATIQEDNAQTLRLNMERYLRWGLDEEFFFISYSTRNILKAEMLKTALEDFGKHVWMAPDGIPQGCDYAAVIPTALKFAKHFVLLLTPYSAKSRWVKRELDIAINNEDYTKVKVLLADDFGLDDIRRDPELHFYLNKVQVKYWYDDVTRNPECLKQFVFN